MDKGHAKIEQIFSQAADLQDGKERAAFLDSVCGQDRQLRAAVERLLKHDVPDSFLESPIVAGLPVATPTTEQVGTMIGPYKLIEEIGEGGHGQCIHGIAEDAGTSESGPETYQAGDGFEASGKPV